MAQFRTFIRLRILGAMPTYRLRAWYLRTLGAQIGSNVRIHPIDLMNADSGFHRLRIGDDCYVGPRVMLDLAGEVWIGHGAVISTRAVILSHDDCGSAHHSPLCQYFAPGKKLTQIGSYTWIGAGAIVLGGSHIGDQCVVGAGSVAKGELEQSSVYAGQPAVLKRRLAAAAP